MSIHEIGHALDHLLDFQSAVSNTSYNDYVTKDFLRFDWSDWDSNGGITPRDPLDAFEGLEDYILDGEELKEEFEGKTNSYILQQISPYFFTTKQARWQELYAQAFAYEAYVQYNDPSDWLYEIPDTLFYHSFFPCTRNWAARIKNGYSTPDGGSACDPAPGWYQIADVLPS